MKNKAIKTKLLTVLLALCMVLSLVPMTAFAAEPTVIDTVDFNHEIPSYRYGDTPRALASVTDSNANYKIYDEYLEECVLVEEREGEPDLVRPTGHYWHSNPLENARLAADKKITKLEPGQGISYHYCVVLEPKSSSYKFTEDTVVNIPNGIPSTGTPKTHPYIRLVDMGIRLRYLYWASVPVIKTITDVSVVNVNTSLSDSAPVSFTAQPGASCADKFDITEEMWEAARPLNDMIKNTDTPRAPIAGGKYWYSLVLTAKPGYEFSRDFSENGGIKEGSGVTFTVNGVSYTGRIAVSADGKTLTAWEFMDPVTVSKSTGIITAARVENSKFDYKPGDAPRATATVAAAEQGKYRIANEYWQELDENDVPVAAWYSDGGAYSTLPTVTAFESGKKYVYSVMLLPERGYDFSREVAATVNGNSVTAVPATDGYLSLPNVKTITPTAESHTHSYGTAWKYDGTNHWHECACGDKADTAVHTFKWVTDKEATETEKGSKHEECTVCGYKKAAVDIPATGSGNGSAVQPQKPGNTSSPQTGDNDSLALWFAVLFISGGALTVLGITSKKKSKKALQ